MARILRAPRASEAATRERWRVWRLTLVKNRARKSSSALAQKKSWRPIQAVIEEAVERADVPFGQFDPSGDLGGGGSGKRSHDDLLRGGVLGELLDVLGEVGCLAGSRWSEDAIFDRLFSAIHRHLHPIQTNV